MARKISLNFTATTGNITTSLDKVIGRLKAVNAEMTKMNKRKLKVQVDDKALGGLVVKSGQAKVGLDGIAKSNLKVKTTSDGASKSMMGFGASMLAMLAVRRSIGTFSELSKEIYTLGTVSQLTTGDIEALRKELISMSDITSAGALSKSIEELVRTGRGLEESVEIISKVSKLAIASGEELGKTSGVIQKIMVSLNLEASRTDEILNILHSTSLNTATSMDQLAVAFKQAGGAIGVFSSLTDKSRKELSDYKIELLAFASASIGVFQNMGRSASQAGIHVRMLTTKIVKFQNTAKKLIDQKLLENAISIDPSTLDMIERSTVGALELTTDKISEIATEDLPKAVELMGKLYNDGILNLSDILTGFTIRHGAFIAGLFAQMGDGYEELVSKITEGRDYLADYEKNSQSLYNQIRSLKNEFIKLGEAIGTGSMIEDGVGVIKSLVRVLSGSGSETENTVANVIKLGVEFTLLSKLIKPVATGITKMSLANLANPITLAVSAMSLLGVAIYEAWDYSRDLTKEMKNLDEYIESIPSRLNVANGELEMMRRQSESIEKVIRDLSSVDIAKVFGDSIGDAEALFKLSKNTYKILQMTEDLKYAPKTMGIGKEEINYKKALDDSAKAGMAIGKQMTVNLTKINELEAKKRKSISEGWTGEAIKEADAEIKRLKKLNGELALEKSASYMEAEALRKDHNDSILKLETELANDKAKIISDTNQEILGKNKKLLESAPAKTIGEFTRRWTEGLSVGKGSMKDISDDVSEALNVLQSKFGKLDFSKTKELTEFASEYLVVSKEIQIAKKVISNEDGIYREADIAYNKGRLSQLEKLKAITIETALAEKTGTVEAKKKITEYDVNITRELDKRLELEQKIAMVGLDGVEKANEEYKYTLLILEAREKQSKLLIGKKSDQFGIGADKQALLKRQVEIEKMGTLKGESGKKIQTEYKNTVELLKLIDGLETVSLEKTLAKNKWLNENYKINQKFAKAQSKLVEEGLVLDRLSKANLVTKSQELKFNRERKQILLDAYNLNPKLIKTQDDMLEKLKLENEIKRLGLDIVKEERAEREAMLSSMVQLGGVLSTISGQTGSSVMGQAGNILGGLGGIGQGMQAGQEAQAMGGLQGALGMAGGYGMAISAGIGMLQGIFNKPADDYSKQNKEQQDLYSENTSALQDLTTAMGQVQSGVRNLSDSLISSIASIPTLEKMGAGQSIMDTILDRMMGTREFGSASWMEEITHSGSKGFAGIGSKPGSTEYRQYTEGAQSLYGQLVGGSMADATLDQLRLFSDRLDTLNKGIEDNYSIMSDLVEAYVNGVEEMQRVSENFAIAINLQSMQGIEYLDKEQYLKQYEDLYDQLGVTMTDEIRSELEDMWRDSPSMVTVTQDMRSSFLDIFQEGGTSMGDAFASTIGDYLGAFTSNLAQVMFDTTFGSQIEKLEDSFLSAMTSLSDLKMEGEKVTTDMISDLIKPSLDEVFGIMDSAKQEGEMFDEVLKQITETGLQMGYTFSELAEAGILDGTSKGLYDTLLSGLVGDASMIDSVMEDVSKKIVDSFAKQSIDQMLGAEILKLSTDLNLALAEGGIEDLGALSQKALELGMMAEAERSKLDAIKDIFDYDASTEYTSENQNITYETGTTSAITNNYYLTSKVEAGSVITSTEDLEDFVSKTLDIMVERFKTDKGIDLESI